MVTPWEEEQILHDVMDGLRVAIHESEVDNSHLNSIKLNKLLYFAVKEFDLPITFSWFKYGASLSDTAVNVDYVEPVPSDQLPNPETPRLGREWEYPTPQEYKYFFKENVDLDHIFSETTKEYLEEFYRGYAPENYAQLYAYSAIFQKTVDGILDMRLDEFNSQLDEIADKAKEEIRELNIEMILHEGFDDRVIDKFTLYSDLILDVFANLQEETDEINRSQFSALQSTLKFYYSHAWKYVALVISENTVTGPSDRDLYKGAVTELDTLDKTYDEDVENVRQRLVKEELLEQEPSVSLEQNVPIPDGDIDEMESALTRIQERREERDYTSLDTEQFLRE